MSGRRKTKPQASTPSPDSSPASSLADKLGDLAVGPSRFDAPASAADLTDFPAAAAAGRKGKGSGMKGTGGGAGPSSSSAASPTVPESTSTALVAASQASPAERAPDKKGGEDSRACAGCGAVGGKTLRCSRCQLVFYCSKDCQASNRWSILAFYVDNFVFLYSSVPLVFSLGPFHCSRFPHSRFSLPTVSISLSTLPSMPFHKYIPPNLYRAFAPTPFFSHQAAHWRSSHKAVCKPQAGEGTVAVVQPRPRKVSAAVRAGWDAATDAAIDLGNSGKYAEARTSAERLLKTIEGVLGPEAEELLDPLDVLSYVTRGSGQLADSYTIMLRALNVSEKHHGEEGMATCRLRSKIGAPGAHRLLRASRACPSFSNFGFSHSASHYVLR